MATFPSHAVRTLLVLVLSGALAGGLSAKPKSSLSDLDLESAEVRLTLERALQETEGLRLEIVQLKEKLAVTEAAAARLSESVTVANSEAELFRRQTGELKLKLEALGLSATAGSGSKLEQRLLTAVSDLAHSEDERKKLSEALIGLIEAVMAFAKVSATSQPDTRLALEAKMREASQLLGATPANAVDATASPATLTDGMVISLKDELALVVANIGAKHGVSVGMPFQVIRGEKLIGTVRMVDVRERIAGAVIQNLNSEKEKIQVGDRLKVAARQ